ncbi:MAG: hypothetical protein H6937_08230 [Burkholderiales bacterium]|nr:hypothetical protein [Burkholderiales bacterium]MCP5252646.1 hypothetical protein [Burkholderiales bacterium]
MTHIIRQQYLHIEVNGTESDGLALQRKLSDLCQHGLAYAIEQVLDRYAPPDGHHVTIERLEIDAGNLTLERLEHDLVESVTQAIESSLRENFESTSLLDPPSAILSGIVKHQTAQQSIQAAFIYFLETGSLPWSFHLPAGTSLEQTVLDAWQDAAKSGSDLSAVKETMRRMLVSPIIRRRLVYQFSPWFLGSLLALLSPEGKKTMEGILQTLRFSEQSHKAVKHFERNLWERAFSHLAVQGGLTSTTLIGETWKSLPLAAQHPDLGRWLESAWPSVTLDESASLADREVTHPNFSVTGIPDTSEHPDAAEGIYIENAGIILLHPFLPRLFEALGIADQDKLLQPERALCLLHFLATGQSVAPEYELVLPKILCDMPLPTPVDCCIELSDAEKEEATALLEAVIRHWEVLRNTSPDGLRGTFLIRSGKVSLRDDGDWLLQVETKSFDMLMDALPWGISIVKLPWMRRTLWVEWV